jgi:hypothetical protein
VSSGLTCSPEKYVVRIFILWPFKDLSNFLYIILKLLQGALRHIASKSPSSKYISFLLCWLDPTQLGGLGVEKLWGLLMKSLCLGAKGCVEKWRFPLPPPSLLTHSITMQTAAIRSHNCAYTLQRFDAGPKLEYLNQRSWKKIQICFSSSLNYSIQAVTS